MKKPSFKKSDSLEHPESPLRFHSPHQSDLGDPPEADSPPYASPAASPENPSHADKHTQCSLSVSPLPKLWNANSKGPAAVAELGGAVREGGLTPVTVKDRLPGADGDQERRPASVSTVSKRVETLQKAALGFRVGEVILCLVSFSVMAADKTKGWSGDSYDRYIEYRYCLAVNVIAFVYSGIQACALVYLMITRKHVHFHGPFDFLMDQILAYLLISASSSAATRLDDWELNWGKDKFTEMATASISTSFLAFIAFASSSLISGFFLFSPDIA